MLGLANQMRQEGGTPLGGLLGVHFSTRQSCQSPRCAIFNIALPEPEL
jgi:hypothetical protein